MNNPPGPRTRDDLQELIASALRRSVTYMVHNEARAAADTILREMRAANLKISRAKGSH